ncbi:protein FAM43A-like [Limulus polyphemus]|uniref:Protein FAM43A-like n=1 Tax=Limulus polyphemus TaxID=6850 RepID=A0ABM1B5Q2_LIMPO|nr:protein FAM43A-like [Limulus polyphemus]
MSIQLPFSKPHIKMKLKFWNKRSISITEYDPVYKVMYLGNVVTPWLKGESCVDMALATLWKNYCSNVKQDIHMTLTVCNSGLKAVTGEHGLTEYWANRITYCTAHPHYPRVFCWVYRHESRRLKHELRCHAVLIGKEDKAWTIVSQLNQRLTAALQEFRREKLRRQKARLSVANSLSVLPTVPRRKQMLITGISNFRPPLERARSAPKLTSIEELEEEEEDSEFEEDFVSDSVISDHGSALYIRMDEVDYIPDHCLSPLQLNDSYMEDVISKVQGSESFDISKGEDSDNISAESGYSEERDTSVEKY